MVNEGGITIGAPTCISKANARYRINGSERVNVVITVRIQSSVAKTWSIRQLSRREISRFCDSQTGQLGPGVPGPLCTHRSLVVILGAPRPRARLLAGLDLGR